MRDMLGDQNNFFGIAKIYKMIFQGSFMNEVKRVDITNISDEEIQMVH